MQLLKSLLFSMEICILADMKTIRAHKARARFEALVENVAMGRRRPVLITRPRSSAVLVSEEEWKHMQKALRKSKG